MLDTIIKVFWGVDISNASLFQIPPCLGSNILHLCAWGILFVIISPERIVVGILLYQFSLKFRDALMLACPLIIMFLRNTFDWATFCRKSLCISRNQSTDHQLTLKKHNNINDQQSSGKKIENKEKPPYFNEKWHRLARSWFQTTWKTIQFDALN